MSWCWSCAGFAAHARTTRTKMLLSASGFSWEVLSGYWKSRLKLEYKMTLVFPVKKHIHENPRCMTVCFMGSEFFWQCVCPAKKSTCCLDPCAKLSRWTEHTLQNHLITSLLALPWLFLDGVVYVGFSYGLVRCRYFLKCKPPVNRVDVTSGTSVSVLLPHGNVCTSILHVFSPWNAVQHGCIDSSNGITNSSPSLQAHSQSPSHRGYSHVWWAFSLCIPDFIPSRLLPALCWKGPVLLHNGGSTLKMSPLEKTIILAHSALPESWLHWEMCSKVTLFLQLPLLSDWSCVGVGLLEAVLFGLWSLQRAGEHWGPESDNTKRTSRAY